MQQQRNNMQMQPQQPMQDMGQGSNMQPQQPMQDMGQSGDMQPQQPMQEQPNDAHLMEEGGQVVDDVTDNRLILDWGVVYTFFK